VISSGIWNTVCVELAIALRLGQDNRTVPGHGLQVVDFLTSKFESELEISVAFHYRSYSTALYS
jgi:hypothetical protein